MQRLSTIKTAAACLLAFLSTGALAHETSIESYMDTIVASHVAETTFELNNNTQQIVANTAYQFTLDGEDEATMVAKVSIKTLTAEEAKAIPENGAE